MSSDSPVFANPAHVQAFAIDMQASPWCGQFLASSANDCLLQLMLAEVR